MFREYGAIMCRLSNDTESGMRVMPVQSAPIDDYPRVSATLANATTSWIGITTKAGLANELVPVMPVYGGLVKAKVKCDLMPVRTGYWVNTDNNGFSTCNHGSGQIPYGMIVTPELDEAVAPGKVVEAMIFTGRFAFDG